MIYIVFFNSIKLNIMELINKKEKYFNFTYLINLIHILDFN
jgi:hypothetical protein